MPTTQIVQNTGAKQSVIGVQLKRKNSILAQDQELLNVLKDFKLEKQDAENLRIQFLRFDDKQVQTIAVYEVDDILQGFEFKFESKDLKKRIVSECDKNKWRRVTFPQLCQIFLMIQKQEKDEQDQEDLEYIDAFVAMGGNPDKSGVIKKDKLIDVIKNEFELTIDIEELIEKSLASCDDLNFQDFCQMFESGGEEIKSKVSLLSVIYSINHKQITLQILIKQQEAVSERRQTSTNLSQSNFNVKYKDFVKWDQKMDEKFV